MSIIKKKDKMKNCSSILRLNSYLIILLLFFFFVVDTSDIELYFKQSVKCVSLFLKNDKIPLKASTTHKYYVHCLQ